MGEGGAAIKRFARRRAGQICFEATCGYGPLHDALAKFASRVVVAHPGRLRLIFRSKRKNDRVDAQKLAKLLHLDEVPAVSYTHMTLPPAYPV